MPRWVARFHTQSLDQEAVDQTRAIMSKVSAELSFREPHPGVTEPVTNLAEPS